MENVEEDVYVIAHVRYSPYFLFRFADMCRSAA